MHVVAGCSPSFLLTETVPIIIGSALAFCRREGSATAANMADLRIIISVMFLGYHLPSVLYLWISFFALPTVPSRILWVVLVPFGRPTIR